MIAKKVIWVSGNPRSGTSLLGKILASCKGCEYSFEPELLPYIINLKDHLNRHKWKEIYQGYIEEELFFNLLVGRKINFRKKEDSSIQVLKSNKEINKKLLTNLSRVYFSKYLKRNKINFIIKFPAIDINKVISCYPKNKNVLIRRNIYSVISSLVKKKWFSNQKNLIDSFLPHKIIGSRKYPYWFDKKYLKIWKKSNEITRCAIFVLVSENYYHKLKKNILINYEDLVSNPIESIKELTKKMNLRMTKNTFQILNTVKRKTQKINVKHIKDSIHPEILKKLKKYESRN